jgi:hypothetical protein
MKHLNEPASEKNAMTEKGQFVDAVEKFFAADAKTVDFSGTKVNGKETILKGQKKTVERMARISCGTKSFFPNGKTGISYRKNISRGYRA